MPNASINDLPTSPQPLSEDAFFAFVQDNGSGFTTFGGQISELRALPTRATATNTSVTASDVYVGVTDTAAPRTITLSTALAGVDGHMVVIKDESGAATTNNITIATEGSELIDGAATLLITADYGVVRLIPRNGNFYTL